jgi:uncharacterized phosphosugar-binding protein
MADIDARALCHDYRGAIGDILAAIEMEEAGALDRAAEKIADHVALDRILHVYGPGGHSNLASQEIFFRAGGLMHVEAILDEGTLLSNGALRSMAIERTPGYGRIVIADRRLGPENLLLLVNAYGINAALIDAALEAKRRGCFTIGVSSRRHAASTSPEHPARHPTKQNLHDVVDLAIDTKVPIGDAVMTVPGFDMGVASISTYANAFALNCLVIRVVARLVERGIEPPVWKSGNAPGGDEANARFLARFQGRIRGL